MKGRIVVISAPSGTGKTTIARRLLHEIPGLEVSVSTTSRSPRPGEKNGVDYFFVSRRRFEAMIRTGEFVEWAVVYGNYYGTSKESVTEKLRQDRTILLNIDTQGGLSIRKAFSEALLIGIIPPSLREQEKRMRTRDGPGDRDVVKRLEESRKERRVLREAYDVRFINKDLDSTVRKIKNAILCHGT